MILIHVFSPYLIKSPISLFGQNQINIYNDNKLVLFSTIEYIEINVSLDKFESQTGL